METNCDIADVRRLGGKQLQNCKTSHSKRLQHLAHLAPGSISTNPVSSAWAGAGGRLPSSHPPRGASREGGRAREGRLLSPCRLSPVAPHSHLSPRSVCGVSMELSTAPRSTSAAPHTLSSSSSSSSSFPLPPSLLLFLLFPPLSPLFLLSFPLPPALHAN